jgi:hypothetical protein
MGSKTVKRKPIIKKEVIQKVECKCSKKMDEILKNQESIKNYMEVVNDTCITIYGKIKEHNQNTFINRIKKFFRKDL